ncbi:MAG TPA: DEAD/DEAH box helicase, partial [Chthoniobacterales bacterium]
AVLKFFATELPALRQVWQVREGERFQHVTRDLVRIEPQLAMQEASDGWLDMRVHFAAGKHAVFSMPEIQQLLRGGQGHVRLKDGRIAVADREQLHDLEEVLRDCDPRQERGAYRVPAVHRGYLEASLAGWKGNEGGTAAAVPPPLGSLRERLRPYQVTGAQWLLAHARAGRGALLADEMGLGKTIQTLAALEKMEGPKLVVCPSSLVWNWKREAAQFLPHFRVLTLDGPSREKRFAEIGAQDLIVTSYALLRRDAERYRGLAFAAVVLDEAQHIKNPDSQNARAAVSLRAGSRFILTGTPIENSVRDLWSLFEFLLPGYLGSRQDFKERYETPILNGERGGVWRRLSRRVQPYLLRRRKSEILTELPDKIEQIIEVELTEKQKATYDQLQQAARSQVDQLNETGAPGAARMRVLTALLRLRQACCDLRLFGGELPMEAASAKLTALLELLEEARDGGHRTLVFSQFTSMLDWIGAALTEREIAYCRLDGGTKDRQRVVERFQNDAAIPVFLISLKAGGVGLNLTAADTVIHFDPWWNPAVEAQATDRAHRIGQKRVVTSIKLIARDTIESRVLSLQQKKRELLEGALDAEAALEGLNAEDLRELVA